MDYDLARLGEREFEHLSQALALRVLGPGVQVFGDGPDGGREASFEGAFQVAERVGGGVWSGYGVLQAKFRRRPLGTTSDARWFVGQVEAELTKWSDPESHRVKWGRLPEYLLLTTNVVLSPTPRSGGIDVVDRLIARHADRLGLRGWEVWHYDKLCRLLDGHDQIRRAYASLLLPVTCCPSYKTCCRAPDPVVVAWPRLMPPTTGRPSTREGSRTARTKGWRRLPRSTRPCSSAGNS